MARYRKKPVVIEAVQFDGTFPLEFLRDAEHVRLVSEPHAPLCIAIRTLEGEMRADIGDWIIRGVQGELYPCKPEIFDATYEPADDERDRLLEKARG
jgi:hypothetical protein